MVMSSRLWRVSLTSVLITTTTGLMTVTSLSIVQLTQDVEGSNS